MPKFIAHGGVSLYIITRVLTRVMNGAILSKLELQKKPRKMCIRDRFSAAIAYFISGKALEPLKELAQQAEKVDQDNLVDVRLEENTVAEFRQLSQSVNQMLDRLAHSFDLQRQFAGNAAHELKTPLAIMQAKLEIFAEEHMNCLLYTSRCV